jgi:glutathione S-transferase
VAGLTYARPMKLVIGSLNYSSWSARAWLALTHAKLPFSTFEVPLKTAADWKERILRFSGAGKVPVLVDGALSIHESLAICEYAAELAPQAALWPADRVLRARARAVCCEMATSFENVRREMPTNVRARTDRVVPSAAARAELARIQEIWNASLEASGGPFLFGHFTIADCMYAPVVTRLRTYGVTFEGPAAEYQQRLLEQPTVAAWLSLAETATAIPEYDALLNP